MSKTRPVKYFITKKSVTGNYLGGHGRHSPLKFASDSAYAQNRSPKNFDYSGENYRKRTELDQHIKSNQDYQIKVTKSKI